MERGPVASLEYFSFLFGPSKQFRYTCTCVIRLLSRNVRHVNFDILLTLRHHYDCIEEMLNTAKLQFVVSTSLNLYFSTLASLRRLFILCTSFCIKSVSVLILKTGFKFGFK